MIIRHLRAARPERTRLHIMFVASSLAALVAATLPASGATAQEAARSSCRSAVQTLAKLVADPPRRDRRVADYIAARQHLDRANRACDGNQGERAMAEADAGIRRLAPDLRGGVLR